MNSQLMQKLKELAQAERLAAIEEREKGFTIRGDFEGSVTAHWVKLEESAAGAVKFNNKVYYSQPIGFVSLPKGTAVELSYADGKYFSKF